MAVAEKYKQGEWDTKRDPEYGSGGECRVTER